MREPYPNELYHYGIKGQKWGIKNGPPYPLNSQKLASNLYRKAKEKEPKITSAVTESVKRAGASMYGLQNRLKTKESIKRKIETDSIEKGISVSEAAEQIKDTIRYTSLTTDKNFVKAYNKIKSDLQKQGYKEVRCKNYFDEYRKGRVKHKSVQSVFVTEDGIPFELQFHTESSQNAKNKKIPLYEERRSAGITLERANQLENQMIALAEKVTIPPGVYTIKSH